MKIPAPLFVIAILALLCGPVSAGPKPVRAHYVITVADDFVVEAYHNGQLIPHSKRELLNERFGATAERIEVEVRAGDWLVFNVVNNRLRWGGMSYFAVAGCMEENHFGFVSNLESGTWSACDTFGDVDRFITEKGFFRHRPAQEVANPWQEGNGLMQQYAGKEWEGTPVWGATRNTWIKVIVK